MRQLFSILTVAFLHACAPPQAAPPAAPETVAAPAPPADAVASTRLSCDWPGFAANASVEGLKQAFGAANVKAMDGEEGIVPVLIYPVDPRRRVYINLYPGSERPFSGASVEDRASSWTMPGGVGMGAALAEVERANGGPFQINLYAGGAGLVDWKGGALGAGACSYFVEFEHGDKSIKTPRALSSDDPALQAMDLKVARFGVN